MIHYHGSPISGNNADKTRFYQGRHALVPFFKPGDLGIIAEVCKTFVFDNSAFSIWKSGGVMDVDKYVQWVEEWHLHPGFRWGLIPDVINGSEEQNDTLVDAFPEDLPGVPVWHLNETPARLIRLSEEFAVVALGSAGEYDPPNSKKWWARIHEIMPHICDDKGRPLCKLHGLRMLNPKVFTKLPLASADSTNAGVNAGTKKGFGWYLPPTAAQRANVIADRVEAHNSAARYTQ
jgi:hypothetical protein